jgi:hypothetical protein
MQTVETSSKTVVIEEKKPQTNVYFGRDQEAAVKIYLDSNTPDKEKTKIFNTVLHKAFSQLVENIVNTYGLRHGFFNMGYDTAELHSIGMAYIIQKINEFDPNRGSKAYSYFGTIVKRHFIRLSMQEQKKYKTRLDLDDETQHLNVSEYEELFTVDQYVNDDKIFIQQAVRWYQKNHLKIGIKIQKEIDIMHAVLKLLMDAENVETDKKKVLYIYVREMTGHETKNITPTIKKMMIAYKHLRQNYINKGEVLSGSVTL